jgi:hypothetical protein
MPTELMTKQLLPIGVVCTLLCSISAVVYSAGSKVSSSEITIQNLVSQNIEHTKMISDLRVELMSNHDQVIKLRSELDGLKELLGPIDYQVATKRSFNR